MTHFFTYRLLRTSEFSEIVPLTCFCGTWNVNNKVLGDEGLEKWLFSLEHEEADIFALGFQEIVELNPMNVALDNSKSISRTSYWKDKVVECMNASGRKYQLISSKNLVGILLLVFVNDSLRPYCTDVRVETAAVGAMGVMANKGGISCSLLVYDTPVCIVCAHLAAKRDNVIGKSVFLDLFEEYVAKSFLRIKLGRNADFHHIIEKTVFTTTELSGSEKHAHDETASTILEHDIILWIGDLNYRIDEEISTEDVFNMVIRSSSYSYYCVFRARAPLCLHRSCYDISSSSHIPFAFFRVLGNILVCGCRR